VLKVCRELLEALDQKETMAKQVYLDHLEITELPDLLVPLVK